MLSGLLAFVGFVLFLKYIHAFLKLHNETTCINGKTKRHECYKQTRKVHPHSSIHFCDDTRSTFYDGNWEKCSFSIPDLGHS